MPDCIVNNTRKDDWGYSLVYCSVERKMKREHRVVFLAHNGYLPEVVMHTCDNPPCVNPNHLVPGTHALNAKDRKEKGRNGKIDGELHPRAKITNEQAKEMRRLYALGELDQTQIGNLFGIKQRTVSNIVRFDTFSGKTSNSEKS